MGERFGGLVDLCAFALVVTGAVITFDRLGTPRLPLAYPATLGLKVALAVWMFALARGLRRRRRASGTTAGLRVLALGLAVMLLAEVLRSIYESALGPPE